MNPVSTNFTHSKIERVLVPRFHRPILRLGEKSEEMGKRGELNNEQVVSVVKHSKDIGEDITIEQAEKMLESMQRLVTLAINQCFRKASGSKRNSSTK